MKVLYAADGSISAEAARELIVHVGDADRLDINVLTVLHRGIPSLEQLPFTLDPIEARRTDAKTIAEAAAEKLLAEGYKATSSTKEGHPGEVIVQTARDEGHDAVIVGAGSRSWLGARLLGSVSTYVLHNSPVTTVLVHGSENRRSDRAKLLFATDGSKDAALALDALADFTDPERCDITVVSVAPNIGMLVAPAGVPIPILLPHVSDEAYGYFLERAEEIVASAARVLREKGFDAGSNVLQGHPALAILDEEHRGGYSLVVIGSRGLGPIRRGLLGSVSDQVARHASACLIGRADSALETSTR